MRTTHSTCRQYLLFGPKGDGILDEMALGGGEGKRRRRGRGEEGGGFGVQRQRGKVLRVSQNCRRPDAQTDRISRLNQGFSRLSRRREQSDN